jgi:hypothetical protein
MGSRVWLLVLGAAFALGGCSDDNTTIVQGGATLVGNFPGTQIIDYLVSDDGRAFNHSGAKITKGIQVFWNGSNGDAIVLYLDGWERLWAHYWNGTTFTPGVELRGPNQHDLTHNEEDDSDDDFESFTMFRVLFLNTSTGGRNGDALILWTREDDPAPGAPTQDSNTRLYGTYFDMSVAGSATSVGDSTVRYGFETEGTTIDFDNVHPSLLDDDVSSIGFVSDSLSFTHAFADGVSEDSIEWPNRFDEGAETALTPATRSGDPTSYAWIVWRKGQRDGVSVVAERFYALQFNLAQVGNALPTQAALGQGLIPPAAGATIPDAVAVDDGIVVHNGCMIWRVELGKGFTGLFLTCFDATGNLGTIELSQSLIDGILSGGTSWAGTEPEMPLPGNVYGGDDGLSSLYAFFRTTEFPGHIAATKTDLDATFDQAAREISPIEGPGGAIVPFSGGKDDFAPETRIDRASQWIFVTWLQDTAVGQLAGLSPGVRIHMHGVQTRTSATARTLADSIVTGGPFLAPNQVTPTNNPSERLFLQSELANGMEDPLCGIQSNTNRINLAWHEGIDPLVELKHNGLTIVPSGVATTPPTGGPSVATGGLVARGNTGYNAFDSDNGLQPVVTDLGTAAGDPLIYFCNNQNNPTDPAAPGAFNEFRVFGLACIPGSAPADAQLVSTDGPNADSTMNDIMTDDENEIDDYVEDGGQFLHVKTTPTSTAAGAHGGTRVHLFFMEARHGENSKPAFRTRYFTKSAFNAASAAASFTTAHTPSLAADPTALSGPANDEEFIPPTVHPDDDEKGPFTAFCTAAGSTVGIYFTTTAHFWYQEFNGTSWLGAPEIIDNESPASIFYGRDQRAYAFPPMRSGTCDNLNGTLVFYAKNPPGEDPGHRRQWVRVHD